MIHADLAAAALRSGSRDDLVAGLRTTLTGHVGFRDERDVMLDLAPFFDAGVRLGANPADVFAEASAGLPADVANLAGRFGGREGVTLAAFGWRLVDTPEGATYEFSWPRWPPPRRTPPPAGDR